MKSTDRLSGLTHARLLELLRYEPETGQFVWRIRRAARVPAGSVAGHVRRANHRRPGAKNLPYRSIGIDGHIYRAARLAWFYMNKEWPADEIDHCDTDSLNDRWNNLRPATRGKNQANTNLYKNNRAGRRGVHRLPSGRWRAMISEDGKNRHIGYFDDADSAETAWKSIAIQIHGDFARV